MTNVQTHLTEVKQKANISSSRDFLNQLFGDKEPDEGKILIWALKGKASRWFKTADEAAAYTESKQGQDVYVGCGLSSEDFGRNKRCPANKIIGLPGFYADIDIADPVHKKAHLPPTLDEAIALVTGHGFDPTLIVHTGHGIHVWWLFKEIWDLTEDSERNKAAELSRRLFCTLQNRCKEKGWDLDSVFDLARVLRIPGTMNCKNEPVMAQVGECGGIRYEPMDLAESFDSGPSQVQLSLITAARHGDGFKIKPDAEPPASKMDALKELIPKFALAWAGKRKDLASPSEYDMSLASFAAQAEWTDQEIANLIIAFRRTRGHDMKKALRVDYLEKTITKAREPSAIVAEAERLKAASESGNHDELRDSLSKHLGIEILSIQKYRSEPSTYVLKTTAGRVDLGRVSGLIEQKYFRRHVADATGRMIPIFPGGAAKKQPGSLPPWSDVAQGMLDLCETVEVGPDGTANGELRSYLVDYLAHTELEGTFEDAAVTQFPFIYEGKPAICLAGFKLWLRQRHGITFTSTYLAPRLRKYGARYGAPTVVVDGKKTTRSIWVLPETHAEYAE